MNHVEVRDTVTILRQINVRNILLIIWLDLDFCVEQPIQKYSIYREINEKCNKSLSYI